MTDLTPVPQPESSGVEALSVQQILELQTKVRENKAAQLRGDPLPHDVTREQLRAAISGIRRQRGTVNFAEKTAAEGAKKKGAAKGGNQIEIVDLDGI